MSDKIIDRIIEEMFLDVGIIFNFRGYLLKDRDKGDTVTRKFQLLVSHLKN
jgi:hypothetical protein